MDRKEYHKIYYQNHKAEYLKRSKEGHQTESYKKWKNEYVKEQYKTNKEMVKARDLLKGLVYRGNYTRQGCQLCGEKPTFFHHIDYSKPFIAFELCDKHHKEAHKNDNLLNNIRSIDFSVYLKRKRK